MMRSGGSVQNAQGFMCGSLSALPDMLEAPFRNLISEFTQALPYCLLATQMLPAKPAKTLMCTPCQLII